MYKKTFKILVILIIILSVIATLCGICSHQGEGNYPYETIRGKTILIHGYGIYKHMSKDVAIQGIAQDYITLFVGVPLLLIGLIGLGKRNLKIRLLLTGVLSYFFISYLFYLIMGMYNSLFLVYAALVCLTFFALVISLLSFDIEDISLKFKGEKPLRFAAGFLIFNVIMIALLWLGTIVPPLLDGSIYPDSLEHYTTLIVQGMDIGLLLPIALVSAILLLKKRPLGYLLVPVYTVFLSLMMTALTAKLIAMNMQGQSIIPAIFIIPLFAILAIGSSYASIKQIKT